MEKKSVWMKEPKCYQMIKEKSDGISFGKLRFPILFNDTIYLLPSEIGEILVKDGYAKESHPKPLKEYLEDKELKK